MSAGVHLHKAFPYRTPLLERLREAAEREGMTLTQLLDVAAVDVLRKVERKQSQRQAVDQG